MNIREALGDNLNQIKLYDDNSLTTGGISKEEETLEEFMQDADLNPEDSVSELQIALHKCGIKQIEEIDTIIEEKIQQKIWDIEEELQINIIDYKWDYKGFQK